MQLSPLQSRLAASLIASFLLILVYLFFFFPQIATAVELDSIPGSIPGSIPDSISPEYETYETDDDGWIYDRAGPSYEPEFAAFDRSIIGRAPAGVTGLKNNEPWSSNIQPGETITCVFELSSAPDSSSGSDSTRLRELRRSPDESQTTPDGATPDEATPDEATPDGDESSSSSTNNNNSLELVRRQEPTRTLYISANTCQQPSRISPDQTALDPPQLSLFVSKSSDNTSPGPDQDEAEVQFIPFKEGAVMFNTTFTEDVFFSIHAPQVSSEHFSSNLPYNFEIAASIDESYHSVTGEPNWELIWVDSDATGALFTTGNLTSTYDEVVDKLPYLLYANNKKDPRINGIRQSYCGLRREAQIRAPENGVSGQIMMGLKKGRPGVPTKQEFYIGGLNASSQYISILVKDRTVGTTDRRRDVAGGGGIVFRETEMDTKPEGACRVIFNLTLCDETQYAVPANTELFRDVQDLEAFYDNYTRTMYDNFEKSLQQVQCEAPSENRFSLVKTCDDCRTAYKNWLCSVAVPRCEDFSEPDRPYLQPRNIDKPFPNGTMVDEATRLRYDGQKAFTSSRNPLIDDIVKPGPYKEVLPCDDVCYQLVQSCPAALGFDCPQPDNIGFDVSYGRRLGEGITCNYPGSAHYPSASARNPVPWAGLLPAVIAGAVVMVLAS